MYIDVTVLTKSRRQTCELSEAQKNLAGRPIEDGGDTSRQRGMRMEYATRGGFHGFEPPNPGRGSEEQTTRGDIGEFALS